LKERRAVPDAPERFRPGRGDSGSAGLGKAVDGTPGAALLVEGSPSLGIWLGWAMLG
jgi:hypothetical protein